MGTGDAPGERCGRTWWFSGQQESGSYTVDMEVESPDAPCSYSPSPSSAPETANASVILFNHWLFGDGSTSTDYTATATMDSSQPTAGATAYFATHHLVLDTDLGRDYLLPGEQLDDHVTFEFSPPLPSNASVGTASMTTISSTAAGETVRVAFAIEAGARTKFVQGTITVPFLPQDLVNVRVDSNGDLILDEADDQIEETEPFRFWVNNDDEYAEGDPEATEGRDCDTIGIECVRDLEDFAMMTISIGNMPGGLPEGATIEFTLADEGYWHPELLLYTFDVEGTQVYSGGLQYLTDPNMASALLECEHYRLPVTDLPNELSADEVGENGTLYILFEATDSQVGPCSLTVRLLDAEGNVYATDTALLELFNFQMYHDPGMYSVASVRPEDPSYIFDNIDPAKQRSLVFVHGFNVTREEALRSSFPTMFKRFYWAGFQGNFVGLTWYGNENIPIVPNPIEPNWFPSNVFNAFESAGPVASVFQSLALNGRVDVFAHSLGNLVVSQVLTNYGPDTVERYVLAQGAVASEAFHEFMPRWEGVWDGGIQFGEDVNALPRLESSLGIRYLPGPGNTTTFLPGMLNLFPWQANADSGYGGVVAEDAVWQLVLFPGATYLEDSYINTYADSDEALYPPWALSERSKWLLIPDGTFESHVADSLPNSVEWAWLTWRFPARTKPAGLTYIPGLRANINATSMGIVSHGAMREQSIQRIYNYLSWVLTSIDEP